jgi:hypothetical protein
MFFASARSHVSAREKKPGELIRAVPGRKKAAAEGLPHLSGRQESMDVKARGFRHEEQRERP